MSSRMFTLTRTSMAFAVAFALGGCAVGPDYKRPAVDMPPAYPDATQGEGEAANSASPAVQADRWTLFGDERLNELVVLVLLFNTDKHSADARFVVVVVFFVLL